MFTVIVEKSFAASHQLASPDGRKEPSHEHNWQVVAAVCAEKLDSAGMVIDFEIVKGMLEQVIAPMRNRRLERLEFFSGRNASAENLARYIYEKLSPLLPAGTALNHIEITEAPGCRVRYCQ